MLTFAARALVPASSFRRSVAVYPGATLLNVMFCLPNSIERLFSSPTTAGRIAFDKTKSGIEPFTEVEVIAMKRPPPAFCMCGMTVLARFTTLKKIRSIFRRHSSSSMERKFLAGGPPEFAIHTSILPNVSATFLTNRCTASKLVTSTASARISELWRARMCSTALFNFISLREHMARRAPSAAKRSAAARAMPSLDPVSSTTLFLSPVSISTLGSRRSVHYVHAVRGSSFDFVAFETGFDPTAQLAANRVLLAGTRFGDHQVIDFRSIHALNAWNLRMRNDVLTILGIVLQFITNFLQQLNYSIRAFTVIDGHVQRDLRPIARHVRNDLHFAVWH